MVREDSGKAVKGNNGSVCEAKERQQGQCEAKEKQ